MYRLCAVRKAKTVELPEYKSTAFCSQTLEANFLWCFVVLFRTFCSVSDFLTLLNPLFPRIPVLTVVKYGGKTLPDQGHLVSTDPGREAFYGSGYGPGRLFSGTRCGLSAQQPRMPVTVRSPLGQSGYRDSAGTLCRCPYPDRSSEFLPYSLEPFSEPSCRSWFPCPPREKYIQSGRRFSSREKMYSLNPGNHTEPDMHPPENTSVR